MSGLPNNPTISVKGRNPHLWPHQSFQERAVAQDGVKVPPGATGAIVGANKHIPKPLLNRTETRYRDKLMTEGITPMEQAITLRLDPPFKSYRADLVYIDSRGKLVLVEVKAPHRFMDKGIAKAALAAKCYPMFRFKLALWQNKQWKVNVLSK